MPLPRTKAAICALTLTIAPALAAHRLRPLQGPQGPLGALQAVQPAFSFRDVSTAAGIVDRGISFGAAAGDANGDGWPDIWSSGHYGAHPKLWVNQGNGTFVDATALMSPPPNGDMHGAQWADLDNDGSQELLVMRGASFGTAATPKFAYRRIGGQLVDVAPLLGLDVPLMRARTPIAVDYDDDGRLDVFLTAFLRPDGLAPPSPYRQLPASPFLAWSAPLAATSLSQFGVLGDLDGDLRLDLLLQSYPTRAFAQSSNGLTSIGTAIGLPNAPTMYDAVIADFDNNGRNEAYFSRSPIVTAAHVENGNRLEFRALVNSGQHEVRVRVLGPHTLTFDWGPLPWWPQNQVFVGAGGINLPATPNNAHVLDPSNPNHTGIAPHVGGQTTGIYVGWEPATSEWVFAVSATGFGEALIRAVANRPMGMPVAVGWNPAAAAVGDLLLEWVNGGLVDRSALRGIPVDLRSRSVVAADFDNDMDLDLYLVTATSSRNTDNVLLANDGSGNFRPVHIGPAVGSADGVGDTVITLDYDRDGRVDLFVVNGDAPAFRQSTPSYAFGDDGPSQLFRNETATGHHWLGIELRGTSSNRDGIGARIEVTAGGRRQIREHGGGMHRYSQNHGIHFGLGPHTTADVLVVWPNGSTSLRQNVQVDRFLQIVQ
jgi:FG-GAP-like repeat/ASPIC and UnbV